MRILRACSSFVFLLSMSLASGVALAAAGASDGISRSVLQTYEIPGTDEEVRMILVEFPPGAQSPKHLHPVVGLNYIIEGVAESQYDDEPMRVFKAGDSYQDVPARKHVVFRNASAERPLKFLITCKIKKGLPFTAPTL